MSEDEVDHAIHRRASQIAREQACHRAAEAERAAIVKWLRDLPAPGLDADSDLAPDALAAAIERGEHLR